MMRYPSLKGNAFGDYIEFTLFEVRNRDMYYRDVALFKNQSTVDKVSILSFAPTLRLTLIL